MAGAGELQFGVRNQNIAAIVVSANASNLLIQQNGTSINIDTRLPPGAGGSGSYQVDILEAGSVVVSNANLNLLNTTSINLLVVANGTTQGNITATINASLNLTSLNVSANISNTGNLLV